jgi:hypothetical protein
VGAFTHPDSKKRSQSRSAYPFWIVLQRGAVRLVEVQGHMVGLHGRVVARLMVNRFSHSRRIGDGDLWLCLQTMPCEGARPARNFRVDSQRNGYIRTCLS